MPLSQDLDDLDLADLEEFLASLDPVGETI